MKFKFKFRWVYLLYLVVLTAVILLTGFLTDHIKLNNYLKNDMHFEAWDLVYNHPNTFALSKKAKDEGILFFDVMATHTADDSNQIDGEWQLPDFTGWSCAEIACALKNIGQSYKVKFVEAPSLQHNVVSMHEPSAGSVVNKDDVVKLYANASYGTPTEAKFTNVYTNDVFECGEWIIISRGRYVLRTHSDFSDIEVLYKLGIEDFHGHSTRMLVNNGCVYFEEEIETEGKNDLYNLVRISIEDKDTEILYQHDSHFLFTHYYDNKLYLMKHRGVSSVFNLDTLEYEEYAYPPTSLVFDDVIYWFYDLYHREENKIGKLYAKPYGNIEADEEVLCTVDGHIFYITLEESNIFIGVINSESRSVVYRYDLSTKELELIYKGPYSPYGLGVYVTSTVFNDEVYLLSTSDYDYKYDIENDRKIPITILTLNTIHKNFILDRFTCGNYLMSLWSVSYYKDVYNLLTNEFEEIDALDQYKD